MSEKTFTVLFWKDNFIRDGIMGTALPMECYEEVAKFPKDRDFTLETIWNRTQNAHANWSDEKHRSMAVGDLIRDDETGEIFICAFSGWQKYDFDPKWRI